MRIYKTKGEAIIQNGDRSYKKEIRDWDNFLNRNNLYECLLEDIGTLEPLSTPISDHSFDPPMGSQEIWASGVTYMKSKEARMEESKKSGGGSFYDRVYDAERPELFFKATPSRTVGHLGTVRIRKDSTWNVPEPELTLFINSEGSIEGYTIGNDMSSRSIEGENPLYLPQAKTYEGCAALGPCLYVPEMPIDQNTMIKLDIIRNQSSIFNGEVPLSNMKRKHIELVDFLFRECAFQNGCFLMTGTGIVPPDEFTLELGDTIHITIDHIGILTNVVG